MTHHISPSLISVPDLAAPLGNVDIKPDDPALATPIIPVLTPHPRPLSAHLRVRGLNARPITWPTVPKGADRIRVCLHAENTRQDVDRLVGGIIEWAQSWTMAQNASGTADSEREHLVVQAKL